MTKTDHDRYLELVTELAVMERDRSAPPITVHFFPYTAFVTVGALQLAWRHPGHSPKLKEIIEQVARQLQDGFAAQYQELLEVGWDPAADVDDGDCPSCPPG